MVTYEMLRGNAAVNTYITRADESLAALGFTEHSFSHVIHVAETAGYILETTGHTPHEVELVKIAQYYHVEDELGFPLVARNRGGASGAGTLLTEKGQAFMNAYDRFYEHLNREAQRLYTQLFDTTEWN